MREQMFKRTWMEPCQRLLRTASVIGAAVLSPLPVLSGGCASNSHGGERTDSVTVKHTEQDDSLSAQRAQHIDPKTADSLSEAERLAVLKDLMTRITEAQQRQDAQTVAELAVSLLPDKTSMKVFLSDSTPEDVWRRLVKTYDEQRAHLREPERAKRLLDAYPATTEITVGLMSLEDYQGDSATDEWKSWFRRDVVLYAVGYQGRGVLPFFVWDGRRWVHAQWVKNARVLRD